MSLINDRTVITKTDDIVLLDNTICIINNSVCQTGMFTAGHNYAADVLTFLSGFIIGFL